MERESEPEVKRRTASEAVARWLADRPHFRRQLVDKLVRRDYSREEIETTLDRFVELGLTDEEEAVRSFVEGKRRRQGWGITRLRAELGRRGAEVGAVQVVLAELDDDSDEKLACREIEVWRRRTDRSIDRLARRLARKGYSTRVIVRLLEGVRAEEARSREP